MKKILILLVAVALMYGLGLVQEQGISIPETSSSSQDSSGLIEAAFNNQQSDVQVQGQGRVV